MPKNNFKNKKVVIMGLGKYRNGSGISAALFFARKNARVLVTDLRAKSEFAKQIEKLKKYSNVKYVFGRHRKNDFKKANAVFRNPSVPKNSPFLKIARANDAAVINDWTLFLTQRPDNLLIGITGSKGKSSMASLIYEILKAAGQDAALCGNIGKSPLAILKKIKKETIVVAELSSWLLQEFAGIKKSPKISVITNLMPDHLDKYENLKEYYGDKENIFKFQTPQDAVILNKDDANLRKMAKKARSRVVWFSGRKKYGAALAIANILKIPKRIALKTIKSFGGLPHRLEFIREKNGVKYYNDSAATIPDAVSYALKSLGNNGKKIILIAGGVDKNLDYKNIVKTINKKVKELILFPGAATDKILKERIKTRFQTAENMKKAIAAARQLSKKGDIVLLSPGTASFNLFKNEFDRGDQFKKFIKKL